MNPIDTQIKEYYQKQPLSEDQLRALRPPEDSPATRPWLLPFAAAATAAAVVLAIFILKPVGLTEAVVTEIAKNHSAHHPMEIRSSDYGEVATALDRSGLMLGASAAAAAKPITDFPKALAAAKAQKQPVFVYVFDSI